MKSRKADRWGLAATVFQSCFGPETTTMKTSIKAFELIEEDTCGSGGTVEAPTHPHTTSAKCKLTLRSDPSALPSLLIYAPLHVSLSQCAASAGCRDQSKARSVYHIYLLMPSIDPFDFQPSHDRAYRSVRVANSHSFRPDAEAYKSAVPYHHVLFSTRYPTRD